MAKALKDFFDAGIVRRLAQEIAAVHPTFNRRGFTADACAGLDRLELIARGWHVAEALRRHLPQDFARAADVLIAALGPELENTESFGMAPLRHLPQVFFAAKYGLDAFEPAMRLQNQLTRRFSAEYSIRPFLERHPQATYAQLERWASDPNVHVRRLVSEGTRPRLPWAPRLRGFQRDPAPVLALLERLKDDPELYVRRSVANNLNDIGKDHPQILIDVCRRWSRGASAERRWIIRHALRSALKRGDRGALALLGFAAKPQVRIAAAQLLPRRPARGQTVQLSFDLISTGRQAQALLADFVVHFVKASGKASPKVFKLRQLRLAPGERASLTARVSFADLTTRRHYPGDHRIDVLLNGVRFPLGQVRLV